MGFLLSDREQRENILKSIDFDPKAIYKFKGGLNNVEQVFSGNSYFSQGIDFSGIKITGGISQPNSFGTAVEFNRKGDIAFVSAPNDSTLTGTVFIYKKNNSQWNLKQRIDGGFGSDRSLGTSISSNFDGTTFVIGDSYGGQKGEAYIFTGDGNSWSFAKKINANVAFLTFFGESVSINSAGNVIAVGAPTDQQVCNLFEACGSVSIFTGSGNNWNRKYIFSSNGLNSPGAANSLFGSSLQLNDIGDRIVVGAKGENSNSGAAYFFRLADSSPILLKKLSGDLGADNFGNKVSIDGSGTTIVAGARLDIPIPGGYQGAAFVFTGSYSIGIDLSFAKKITEEPGIFNYFGSDVKINNLGNKIIVGGTAANSFNGAAWIYTGEKQNWNLYKKVSGDLGNDLFGTSVSLDSQGKNIIIGAETDNNQTGAAWIFTENLSNSILYKETTNKVLNVVNLQSISSDGAGNRIIYTSDINNAFPSGKCFIIEKNENGAFNRKIELTNFGLNASGISASKINDIGDIAVIGGKDSNNKIGRAWVFVRNNNNWNLKSTLNPDLLAPSLFGLNVEINSSGNILAVGAPLDGLGSFSIFTGNKDLGWNFCQKINLIDFDSNVQKAKFGYAISMNSGGDIIAVQAPDYTKTIVSSIVTGAYFIFTGNGSTWNLSKKIQNDSPNLGAWSNLKLNKGGDKLFTSSQINPNSLSGFINIYTGKNTDWNLQSSITLDKPNTPGFGNYLAINKSGNLLITTSSYDFPTFINEGFIYKEVNNSWNLIDNFTGNRMTHSTFNAEGNLIFIGKDGNNITEIENKNISVYEQGSLSGYKRSLAFDGERWTDFQDYKNNNYNIPQDALITLNTKENINIQPNVNSKFVKYRDGEFFNINKKSGGGGQFILKKENQLNDKGFFPALGNHDYDDSDGTGNEFLQYFSFLKNIKGNTSGKQKYYDFKIKNCHFFVLDSDPVVGGSNRDGNISLGAGKGDGNPNSTSNSAYVTQQRAWFNNTIKNSTSKYKFVFFHHPSYSSGPVHGGHPKMSIEQGWKFHLADFVFHGHEHLYERSRHISSQQYPIYPHFVFTRLSPTQLKIEYYYPGIAWNTTQLRINIGHDDWQDLIVQANMTKNNNNGWEYIYTFPQGSDTVNFAVRTNGGIWDNNTIGGRAYNYIYYLNDSNDFSKTRFIINGNGGVGLYNTVPISTNTLYLDDFKGFTFNSDLIGNQLFPKTNYIKKFVKKTFSSYLNLNPESPVWVSDDLGPTPFLNTQIVVALFRGLLGGNIVWMIKAALRNTQTNSLDLGWVNLAVNRAGAEINSNVPIDGWIQQSSLADVTYGDSKIFNFENVYRKNSSASIYGFSKITVYNNGLLLKHIGINNKEIFSVFDEDSIGKISENEKELEFAVVADWGLPNGGEELSNQNIFSNPGNNLYVEKISEEIKRQNIPYIFAVGDLNYIDTPLSRGDNTLPFHIDENIGRFYSDYMTCYRGAYQNGVINNLLLPNLNVSICQENYSNYYPPLDKQYDLDYKVINSFSAFPDEVGYSSARFGRISDINLSGDKMVIGNFSTVFDNYGIHNYSLNKQTNNWELVNTLPTPSNSFYIEKIKMSKNGNITLFSTSFRAPTSGSFVSVISGNNFYDSPQSVSADYRRLLPNLQYAVLTEVSDLSNGLAIDFSGKKCAIFYRDSRFINNGCDGVLNIYENIFPNTSVGTFHDVQSVQNQNYNTLVSRESHWKLTGQKIFTNLFRPFSTSPFSYPELKMNDNGDLIFLAYRSGMTLGGSSVNGNRGVVEIYSGNNLNLIERIILPTASIDPTGLIYLSGFSDVDPGSLINYSLPSEFDISSDGSRMVIRSKITRYEPYFDSFLNQKDKLIDDTVYIYDLSGTKWNNTAKITDFDTGIFNFAERMALCKNNKDLLLCSTQKKNYSNYLNSLFTNSNTEVLSIYKNKNNTWQLLQRINITGNIPFTRSQYGFIDTFNLNFTNNGKTIMIPFSYNNTAPPGGVAYERGAMFYISGEIK